MRKSLYFAYFLIAGLLFALGRPTSAGADDNCRIGIESGNQFAVYSLEPSSLVPVFELNHDSALSGYSLSPNHRYLAQERENLINSSGKEIVIFDLGGTLSKEVGIIPDERLIGGQHWSHDSTRLLTQDAHENQWISYYDLITQQKVSLSEHFNPGLEVWQVTWGPTSETIGFYAFEKPFPTTEYGINGVGALYTMNLDTLAYRPLSAPTEEVGWYFNDFFILSGDTIAVYLGTDRETGLSGLRSVSRHGDKDLLLEGEFFLRDQLSNGQFMLLELIQSDNEANLYELISYDLEKRISNEIIPLSVDPNVAPFPLFSLSTASQMIAYVDQDGKVWLTNIQTQSTKLLEITLDTTADISAGAWSRNGKFFLIDDQKNLYLHDLRTNDTRTIMLPEPVDNSGYYRQIVRWLCPEN